MTNELFPFRIEYTPEFLRNLKALRKYRNIKADIAGFLETLQTGHLPGDLVPNAGYVVYKARVKNSDLTKGKSGGYRIVYHVSEPDLILLIVIYSKSDQTDINVSQIARLIHEYYEANSPDEE